MEFRRVLFRSGVWFSEFAPVRDPALVPQVVAASLGVREEPGRNLTQSLAEYLRSRLLLLVLDNCEHLIQPIADLADSLTRSCPHLFILATSQEPFRIPGEKPWRVPSLSMPEGKERPGEPAKEYGSPSR